MATPKFTVAALERMMDIARADECVREDAAPAVPVSTPIAAPAPAVARPSPEALAEARECLLQECAAHRAKAAAEYKKLEEARDKVSAIKTANARTINALKVSLVTYERALTRALKRAEEAKVQVAAQREKLLSATAPHGRLLAEFEELTVKMQALDHARFGYDPYSAVLATDSKTAQEDD